MPILQASRFNGSERGLWYAAFRLETAQAEVAFHLGKDLWGIRSKVNATPV